VVLNGNIAEKITRIKQQEGPDLHVYGSANLVQTLLQQDLVDAFWLKVFPITLGAGIRLFAEWVDHRSCCGQRHLTPRRALPAVRRS
jgi:dihydrofolate reductase